MKILSAAVFSAAIFAVPGFQGYGVLAVLVVLAAAVARIPISFLWRGVRPLALLIAITMVLHVLFTPGDVIASLGPLRITEDGVRTAVQMAVRLVLLLTGVSIVTLTTPPLVLTDGLERLLSPMRRLGVPAHEIAMMMTIALRFIPTLLEELDKIIKAQVARGADFEGGGLVRRIRAMVPLLVPLFTGVFRRAEELAIAMESRAYRGGIGRTKLKEPVLTAGDVGALVFTVVLAAVAVRWV